MRDLLASKLIASLEDGLKGQVVADTADLREHFSAFVDDLNMVVSEQCPVIHTLRRLAVLAVEFRALRNYYNRAEKKSALPVLLRKVLRAC